MSQGAIDALRERAQAVRTRGAVRAWHYRQRNLADGVWFRLRRVLADAQAAYAISDEDAAALMAEGRIPEPSGLELSPAKTLVFIDERRLAALDSPRAIPVSLGVEFLLARAVALVPFGSASTDA